MSHCKLCNCVAGSTGSVHDLDALGLGIFMVDIIDTNAAADDELEPSGLKSRVDDGSADLGSTPYYENIKILDLLCKLLGSIELFNDFVTLVAECCNSVFFHTV